MNGFIVSAILCVILSFAATGVFRYGVWGLIVAQIISQAVYNMWKWPVLAHKEMQLTASEMISAGTFACIAMVKRVLKK